MNRTEWESRLRRRGLGALEAARLRASAVSSACVRARDTAKEWLVPLGSPPFPTVGVGIVTYNRPGYFQQVIGAALEHLAPVADLYVYNDGSSPNDEYRRIFATLPKSVSVCDA